MREVGEAVLDGCRRAASAVLDSFRPRVRVRFRAAWQPVITDGPASGAAVVEADESQVGDGSEPDFPQFPGELAVPAGDDRRGAPGAGVWNQRHLLHALCGRSTRRQPLTLRNACAGTGQLRIVSTKSSEVAFA